MPINKLDLSTFDKETGELTDGRPDCPFRSLTDNKNYDGREPVSNLPSMTICNGYQSIQQLYERCMRFPVTAADFDDSFDIDVDDSEAFMDTPDEDDLEVVQRIYDSMATPVPEKPSTPTTAQEKSAAVDVSEPSSETSNE